MLEQIKASHFLLSAPGCIWRDSKKVSKIIFLSMSSCKQSTIEGTKEQIIIIYVYGLVQKLFPKEKQHCGWMRF